MTLRELQIGQSAIIQRVGGEGALRQHFLDMGVIPGARVSLIKYAPMGDPMELMVQGYELTLRLAEAEQIEVVPVAAEEESSRTGGAAEENGSSPDVTAHPGLGEGGKFHPKGSGDPLPD